MTSKPLRMGFGCREFVVPLPSTAAWNPAVGVFLLDYTMLGNESNSGMSGKRNWWLRSEIAQIRAAKLAPLTERLTRVAAPKSSY